MSQNSFSLGAHTSLWAASRFAAQKFRLKRGLRRADIYSRFTLGTLGMRALPAMKIHFA